MMDEPPRDRETDSIPAVNFTKEDEPNIRARRQPSQIYNGGCAGMMGGGLCRMPVEMDQVNQIFSSKKCS